MKKLLIAVACAGMMAGCATPPNQLGTLVICEKMGYNHASKDYKRYQELFEELRTRNDATLEMCEMAFGAGIADRENDVKLGRSMSQAFKDAGRAQLEAASNGY